MRFLTTQKLIRGVDEIHLINNERKLIISTLEDKKSADKASKKLELDEIQLTYNGEEHFSYSNSRFWARGTIDSKREKEKNNRKNKIC